jgi:hypothetical protein
VRLEGLGTLKNIQRLHRESNPLSFWMINELEGTLKEVAVAYFGIF